MCWRLTRVRRSAGRATRWPEPVRAALLAGLLIEGTGGAWAQGPAVAPSTPAPASTQPHARVEAADGSFGLPPGASARSAVFSAADGRAVHARLWWPATPPRDRRARGLILFSHGANSQPAKYDRLAGAWAAAGWVVVGPVHMDSPDHPDRPTVSPDQGLALRLADLRTPLAWLGGLERAVGLAIPADRVVAAGHSYGALVAQALAGAVVQRPGDGGALPDPRVRAVVAFSPPGPLPGYVEPAGWARVALPQFVQTGTADIVPPIAARWEDHRASFDAATVSPRWLWVGEGVDHYFGNLIGRPEREAADQSAAFACAVTASLAFMERVLGDRRADPSVPCGPRGLVRVEAR
jgi:hypothetical protein